MKRMKKLLMALLILALMIPSTVVLAEDDLSTDCHMSVRKIPGVAERDKSGNVVGFSPKHHFEIDDQGEALVDYKVVVSNYMMRTMYDIFVEDMDLDESLMIPMMTHKESEVFYFQEVYTAAGQKDNTVRVTAHYEDLVDIGSGPIPNDRPQGDNEIVEASTSVMIYDFNILVEKDILINGNPVPEGDIPEFEYYYDDVQYRLRVTNLGSTDLKGLVFVDPLLFDSDYAIDPMEVLGVGETYEVQLPLTVLDTEEISFDDNDLPSKLVDNILMVYANMFKIQHIDWGKKPQPKEYEPLGGKGKKMWCEFETALSGSDTAVFRLLLPDISVEKIISAPPADIFDFVFFNTHDKLMYEVTIENTGGMTLRDAKMFEHTMFNLTSRVGGSTIMQKDLPIMAPGDKITVPNGAIDLPADFALTLDDFGYVRNHVMVGALFDGVCVDPPIGARSKLLAAEFCSFGPMISDEAEALAWIIDEETYDIQIVKEAGTVSGGTNHDDDALWDVEGDGLTWVKREGDPPEFYEWEDVVYRFTISNPGTLDLYAVTFMDSTLYDVEFPIHNLPAGEDVVLYSYGVEYEDPEMPGLYENTAEAWGYIEPMQLFDEFFNDAKAEDCFPDPSVDDPDVWDDDSETVLIRIPIISVEKMLYGDPADGQVVDIYEEVPFTFTIMNEGNVAFSSVLIEDYLTKPDAGMLPIVMMEDLLPLGDTLDPGDTLTMPGYLDPITYLTMDEGSHINEVTVMGFINKIKMPDEPPVLYVEDDKVMEKPVLVQWEYDAIDRDDLDFTVLKDPELTVTKTADPEVADIGDEITYTILIENTGNVDFGTVLLQDVDDIEVLIELTDIAAWNGGEPGLKEGEDVEITVTTSYDAEYENLYNWAYVWAFEDEGVFPEKGQEPPPHYSDYAIVDIWAYDDPGIDLLKEVNGLKEDDAYVDEMVTYSFLITNTGDVELTDILLNDPMLGIVDMPIPDLAPFGGDYYYEKDHSFSASGDYENIATVTAKYNQPEEEGIVVDGNEPPFEPTHDPADLPPVSDSAMLYVTNPMIQLTKTAVNGDGSTTEDTTWDEGDTVWYWFRIENVGDTMLYDIELRDSDISEEWLSDVDLAPEDSPIDLWFSEVYSSAGTYTNVATARGYLWEPFYYDLPTMEEEYMTEAIYMEWREDTDDAVVTVDEEEDEPRRPRTVRYDLIVTQVGEGTVETGTFTGLSGLYNVGVATPAEGWEFVGWFGDDGGSVQGPNEDGEFSINMSRDREIEAVFEAIPEAAPVTLTIVVTGEGNISSQVVGPMEDGALYRFGPLEGRNGYEFISIGGPDGDDLILTAPTSWNLVMDSDKEIHILFEMEEEETAILDEEAPLAPPAATGGLPLAVPIIGGLVTIVTGMVMKKKK